MSQTPSPIYSTITIAPNPCLNNNISLALITITIKDTNNVPIQGYAVPTISVTGFGNTIIQASGYTDANGQCVATLKSSVAESKTVSITAPTVLAHTTSASVVFGTSSVSAANSYISCTSNTVNSGSAQSVITFTVLDTNKAPIAGYAITFASTGTNNTLVQPTLVTDKNGQAFGYIASTTAQTKTISITAPAALTGVSTATTTFVASGSSSASNSTMSVDNASLGLNNKATITLNILDSNSNPVVGITPILATSGSGTLTQPSASNSNGVSIGSITSAIAGSNIITVTSPAALTTLTPINVKFIGSSQWSLAAIRLQVRQRCDMVNSQFVSDVEMSSYISCAYKELYDILVSRFEDYYTKYPATPFTIVTGNTYTLPDDFYKLRAIDAKIDGSDYWYGLKPFNFSCDRNVRNRLVWRPVVGRAFIMYQILGNTLYIIPEERAQLDYQIWYIPRAPELVNDSDTIDAVNGWEEYVVLDACIKALTKEESDTTVFIAQKQDMIKRIEAMASNRDSGMTQKVGDAMSGEWGYNWPYYY